MANKRAPHSKLRPPVVVGPGLIYPAPKIGLATRRAAEYRRRAIAKSVIRKPNAVGPPVTTPPPAVYLAWRRAQVGRTPAYFLGKPVAVNPAVTFGAAKLTLARRDRRLQHARPLLGTPIVQQAQAPVYTPAEPLVKLVQQQRRRPASYALRQPIVVAPASSYTPAPAKVTLAQRPKWFQKAQHIVGTPIVGAIVFPAPTVKLAARSPKLRPVQHWINEPAAVNPAFTFPAAQLHLARRSVRIPGSRSSLRAPTVVDPFVPPPPAVVQAGTDWASMVFGG